MQILFNSKFASFASIARKEGTYLTHILLHCFDWLRKQPPARAGYLEKLQLPNFCHFPGIYMHMYAYIQLQSLLKEIFVFKKVY